jgi:hypothetical protein
VRLTRSSLCGILLEQGEEDLAVIVASADLPEILDTSQDAPALAALGLSERDLHALLPAVAGDPTAGGPGRAHATRLAREISDRWAHLVDIWTGSHNGKGRANEHDG